jgi:hypothetical protein
MSLPEYAVKRYAGFDDRHIPWAELPPFEHFVFAMLDVDRERCIADFILKFEPGQRIFLHRHTALTHTLVLAGEHRLYEPDGRLKEIRPVGSYTTGVPSDPHCEGGGADGGIVLYSVRGGRSPDQRMFEVLSDGFEVVGTLGLEDFVSLMEAQRARLASAA